MRVSALQDFVCPIDGLPLIKERNSYQCEKNHVFDIAKEGYCNLLLVQQKASLNPGDCKEMVSARQRFLNEGHFAPIADHLFQFTCQMTKKFSRGSLKMVDAGCGEGYYLHEFSKRALADKQMLNLALAGCDISKWAVKAAAKRSSDIAWAVAGNRQLPFAPGTVDLLCCMFGYPDWQSFEKIQSADGYLFLIDPGPKHLMELKEIIYPEIKKNKTSSVKESGYMLDYEDELTYALTLENNVSIQDLLAMTPHTHRITQKAREKIKTLKNLTLTINVHFRAFKRKR